jgi:hypothetical protein
LSEKHVPWVSAGGMHAHLLISTALLEVAHSTVTGALHLRQSVLLWHSLQLAEHSLFGFCSVHYVNAAATPSASL